MSHKWHCSKAVKTMVMVAMDDVAMDVIVGMAVDARLHGTCAITVSNDCGGCTSSGHTISCKVRMNYL